MLDSLRSLPGISSIPILGKSSQADGKDFTAQAHAASGPVSSSILHPEGKGSFTGSAASAVGANIKRTAGDSGKVGFLAVAGDKWYGRPIASAATNIPEILKGYKAGGASGGAQAGAAFNELLKGTSIFNPTKIMNSIFSSLR